MHVFDDVVAVVYFDSSNMYLECLMGIFSPPITVLTPILRRSK